MDTGGEEAYLVGTIILPKVCEARTIYAVLRIKFEHIVGPKDTVRSKVEKMMDTGLE